MPLCPMLGYKNLEVLQSPYILELRHCLKESLRDLERYDSQGNTDGLMSLLFAGLAFDLHCSVSRSQSVRTVSNTSSKFGSGRNSTG